jgi:hypothetical protein
MVVYRLVVDGVDRPPQRDTLEPDFASVQIETDDYGAWRGVVDMVLDRLMHRYVPPQEGDHEN